MAESDESPLSTSTLCASSTATLSSLFLIYNKGGNNMDFTELKNF